MSDEFVILLDQPEAAPVENSEQQEEFVILLDAADAAETGEGIFSNDLTIECAHEFKQHLLSEFASGEAVSVNLLKLKRVDTSALQLLSAAAIKASADGVSFTLEKPNQIFRDAVKTLGFCSSLEALYSE